MKLRLARRELQTPGGGSALLTLLVIVVAVAGLYLGRQFLVPLALATLLSFALAPPVRWLRRMRLPNTVAVILVTSLAFLTILAIGSIIASQVGRLAQRLPAYELNIENKIESLGQSLSESPPGGQLLARATDMVRNLGRKIEEVEEEATKDEATPQDATEEPEPLPVVVETPAPTSTQLIRTVLGPLVRPLTTAGIVIVFVIFMLLKREDLRDRLIRLLGPSDLPRTSEALDDAAWRVGHYLLMQLVVNTLYAVPITIGLWVIGLPNPLLWGLLCLLLRFVPYIGPIIAAALPLAIAVAVDPGWTMLLWTGALFIVVELITNNLLEPWLYGASAGLSPVAIIAAAVFWTWLWGPIGLLLSTPLTVCLMVLGRYVPQLAFLDVLLGDGPGLTQSERLYQRLLAGDPHEATERAEEYLRDHSLTEYYDDVAIPALAFAEHDRKREALDEKHRVLVAEGTEILIDNLEEWEETGTDTEEEGERTDIAVLEQPGIGANGDDANERIVLCAGARGHLDDAAAAMLQQLLEHRRVTARILSFEDLQTAKLRQLDLSGVVAVVLSYMNADSMAHARLLVRRLRRRLPEAAIMVGFWTFPPEEIEQRDPIAGTGADAVATTLKDAVEEALGTLSARSKHLPNHELPGTAAAAQ